jgi:choline dehydrogenase-like flavoprotein
MEADVCLVGAGTGGLFLAEVLRRKGIRTVVLEAGGANPRTPAESDERCEQAGVYYRGADLGRSFGLGGTSALWGGQLLPLSRSDFEARPGAGGIPWPVSYADLEPFIRSARETLGLPANDSWQPPPGLYDELQALSGDFVLRMSDWIPFRRRNMARTFAATVTKHPGVTVWLDANVVSLSLVQAASGATVSEALARSPNGKELRVRARFFVICAGALESTRLLLALDRANGAFITRGGAPLGRYFSDHLSVRCGQLTRHAPGRYNMAVAPSYYKGALHTPRLELSAQAQRSEALPSAFAHFTFISPPDSGFNYLRRRLRREQGVDDGRSGVAVAGRVARDLVTMGTWLAFKRRLWISPDSQAFLHVDIEQRPHADSQLRLAADRDSLGRERLVVDWRVHEEDVAAVRRVAGMVMAAWSGSAMSRIAALELSIPSDMTAEGSMYDVYHPTGTIRMGSAANDSVVDPDLRLWACTNCFVTTTAVFPSSGSANPGMTHFALTARLGQHLHDMLRGTTP